MNRFVLVVLALLLIIATLSTRAASTRAYRLVQPWSKLDSLTDAQREKIYHIHRHAHDEMKTIRDRERKEILALLSDDQKIELVEAEENFTVERKKEAAASRVPTTAAATQSVDAEVDARDHLP